MEWMVGMKKAIGLLILIILIGSSGCVQKPNPVNPKGPNATLTKALNDTEQYLVGYFKGIDFEYSLTPTNECNGAPCSWSGSNAGNCTNWLFYYECIQKNESGYFHKTIRLSVRYSTGGTKFIIMNQISTALDTKTINETISNIQNRSLRSVIHFESRDIFLISKSNNIWNSTGYYLFKVALNYYVKKENFNNTPVWWIRWEYKENKDRYDSTYVDFYVNGINGTVLKIAYPSK